MNLRTRRCCYGVVLLAVGAGFVQTLPAQNAARGKAVVGRQSRAADASRKVMRPGDVDLARSRAFVLIGATGLGHEHGAEGRLAAGEIHLGSETNAGKLVFDMPTFVAETAASRKYVGLEGEIGQSTARKVTENMLGGDVLNVEKFRTAQFVIHSAMPAPVKKKTGKADPPFVLDGEFTLHGATRPLKVMATATAESGGIRLRGRFTVKQTDFGITPYSKALGAVGVADELTIWGDVWLHDDAVSRS